MTQRIAIRICTGTTCYILGGASLLNLAELLPAELRGQVDIAGVTCLGFCRDERQNNWPPYVTVGGTVVERATVEAISSAVRAALALPAPKTED